MKRIMGLIVAGALWLGMAPAAEAQFSFSYGSPYYGGVSVTVPSVGVYGGGVYGAPYAPYGVVPGATYYSSGYYGVAPVVPPVVYPAYGYRPYYGVAAYPRFGYYGGYGGFGYGGFVRRGWGFY